MAATGTRSKQAAGKSAVPSAEPKETSVRRSDTSRSSEADVPQKAAGYGLPCSKCHLYYPADLDVCPTCKHRERVAPVRTKMPARPAQSAAEPIPDTTAVEQEREEFLRQFKAQILEAHAEIASPNDSVCNLAGHRSAEATAAEVCKACYEGLQERVDILEAALHIDLKEAAQIIYDAVWADPSHPGKTYQNAASALLTELRKRGGVSSLMGPFQKLSH